LISPSPISSLPEAKSPFLAFNALISASIAANFFCLASFSCDVSSFSISLIASLIRSWSYDFFIYYNVWNIL